MIEMMVVLAIIALMAVIAVPSVSSYFSVSLSSTAREIAGTVKETYNATVITGQVHRIVYDIKENSYWVEAGPTERAAGHQGKPRPRVTHEAHGEGFGQEEG